MASRIKYVLNILDIIVLLILAFVLVRILGMYVVQPYGETHIKIILNCCQETTSRQEFFDLCRNMENPGALSIVPTSEGIRMETSVSIFGSYTCLFVEFLEEDRLKFTLKERDRYYTKDLKEDDDDYLDRKEFLAFYEKLEPGMTDMEVLAAFREMNPSSLRLSFMRRGFTVREKGKLSDVDWHLDIKCRDGYIQRLEIREDETKKHPEEAPPDKVL